MPGFRCRGPEIDLDLSVAEVELLALALPLLEAAPPGDPGDPPPRYPCFRAHPGDDEAEARFRDLTAGSLQADRGADRRRYAASLERGTLGAEDAAAWLRVLAEARLSLAERLGVATVGCEDASPSPGLALLALFGSVADELAATLLH
ncbi:MAG: DUF2017 family protein [Actinomycetota bacterium]